jgi:hypothetical protein
MNHIVIKLPGTDLAARRTAAGVRHKVVEALSAGNRVIIDFADIKCVAHAYADELFGVLAVNYGFDTLTVQVKIVHAKQPVLRAIAAAIGLRLQATGQT